MKQVVLLIGGNLGDRSKLIQEAKDMLRQHVELIKGSSLYETAAWGGKSSGSYLNQALVVETELEAEAVLDITQGVENALGRERLAKWGDRTMDIDIIYFGDEVVDTARLKVPHPLMTERRFVLTPIVEILPDFVHPVLQKNNRELLESCTDESAVAKVY
ncbi:2-amino-4-hydroxy-6-hydroxymethyldihydropteridine diphosphokinase [Echinicola strongylocentroti]|uniref:2-amino-4-hydroxy-6-hydroxymethyldihydropteridine pyrophosphokinase n=1 Tax=Echinicola strongylocentroti TaxID=1795355 RepID=A0A2Z4IN10_9BACT|nr:2-amino-4-hydroxy-6-hydroxymethyldihydropteridine diphosphokinase [Echinicola strongylocentroti]AWW32285.1 2-amino-4-hydroxy-6-hydroxymethyldihydropteridine diphosphokinase [Echinicola strongylocentroti]